MDLLSSFLTENYKEHNCTTTYVAWTRQNSCCTCVECQHDMSVGIVWDRYMIWSSYPEHFGCIL